MPFDFSAFRNRPQPMTEPNLGGGGTLMPPTPAGGFISPIVGATPSMPNGGGIKPAAPMPPSPMRMASRGTPPPKPGGLGIQRPVGMF